MIKIPGKFIKNKAGQKKAFVIPYRAYEHLLEDLHDLAVVAERKTEKTLSHDEVKARLRKDGLL